jgi:hypothetical protein
MKALAAFMRAVTKQVATPLMVEVAKDKLKMAKIEEYYEQFIVDYPFDDGTKKKEVADAPKMADGEQATTTETAEKGDVDPRL